MQVSCKLQLTSESESSESIHTNCEHVRLCATAELDKNSTLIVLVCSNETSNNHILAYYMERRQASKQSCGPNTGSQTAQESLLAARNGDGLTIAHLAHRDVNVAADQSSQVKSKLTSGRLRPKIVVKQIYYHSYNEDIVALCLSENANKLILISASSTIYTLPIKNVLLDLHAQQIRSSQGRSMYFYDATILSNLRSIDDPVSIVCWESAIRPEKSYIIVACRDGNRLVFIDVGDKKELCSTSVSEPIRRIEIIRDRFSCSLVITCESYNQYRLTLELLTRDQSDASSKATQNIASPTVINLPKATPNKASRHLGAIDDEAVLTERDFTPSWTSKPLLIKLNSGGSNVTASAIHRVFTPASRLVGSQAGLTAVGGIADVRDRPLSLLINQQPNLIGVIDVLGAKQPVRKSNMSAAQYATTNEPRLLRFYPNRQYFYRPHRPQIICKLNTLDPDEMITHMVLTERFIALATDHDRCLVKSRNCCKLKNPSPKRPIELNPLVKEVTFNNEEKILALIKSPVIHDQDNILDSFILVTTRSIYSIDARHNCRDLFIKLIDSHLAIKRTLFTPRMHFRSFDEQRVTSPADGNSKERHLIMSDHLRSRSAESNLLINDFLQHREVYERICHDSLAFSTLFKLELSSLYEAYADRLLQRQQFELANRFFHMATFNHPKILGKYIRIGAYNETIDYVRSILNDDNDFRKILGENERLEIAKIAFECLLCKLLVERSKLLVYKTKLKRSSLDRITGSATSKSKDLHLGWSGTDPDSDRMSIYRLCEHSPRGQDAKLSTTTIVDGLHEDEEETLTSNTDGDDSSQRNLPSEKLARSGNSKCRPECEKALIDFIKHLMPSSLYDYAIDRLLDFDLVELVDSVAQTDMQILSFLKALIRSREDERLLFRASKLESLTSKLERLKRMDLMKINTDRLEFLEFMTSSRVTKALVKDISLTCDFYGYQHTLVQFRKYSFAALRHLDTYKQLIKLRNDERERVTRNMGATSCDHRDEPISAFSDDNANDGISFVCKDDTRLLLSDQQKQTAEAIFVEFLTACLKESTDDSCRLWFNYINFYLNYIGDLPALEMDILRLIETSGDCRLAISLYRAIYRDETANSVTSKNGTINGGGRKLNEFRQQTNHSLKNMSSFLKANLIANTPLEAMQELHDLTNLFANEFLMRLLRKTLDLLPEAADLDALTIATMC